MNRLGASPPRRVDDELAAQVAVGRRGAADPECLVGETWRASRSASE
jgi:hypothetical protein